MLNTLQIEKLQIVEVCCLMEIIKQVKSIDTPFMTMTMDAVHTNVPLLQRCKLLPKVQKLPLRRLFVAEWAI
jgi:hypothetical protein